MSKQGAQKLAGYSIDVDLGKILYSLDKFEDFCKKYNIDPTTKLSIIKFYCWPISPLVLFDDGILDHPLLQIYKVSPPNEYMVK